MAKERIHSDHAPAALGPYSQAIRAGSLLYTAGQVGLDPATGQLVEGGIVEQTQRALENLGAVLQAAGGTLHDVVKTTVFLADMAHFGAMNEVYKAFFSESHPPARSTVQVAGLPKEALVEIECVAMLDEGVRS